MPRSISGPLLTALSGAQVYLAILAQIQFKSMTSYVWTGSGSLSYGGNTYLGIGSLGKVGPLTETNDRKAGSVTVTLGGIDPTLLNESLTDIQTMAPATLLLAAFDGNGNLVGTPLTLFAGVVGKPTVQPGAAEISITLNLETRLKQLQRASNRRYTAADQNLYFPGDTFFHWVETQNDIALKFGP